MRNSDKLRDPNEKVMKNLYIINRKLNTGAPLCNNCRFLHEASSSSIHPKLSDQKTRRGKQDYFEFA